MKRRKIRKYRAGRRNSGVKFLWIIGIIVVATVGGYLTARFIIGPMLGYDTEVLKLDFPSNITSAFKSDKEEDSKTDVDANSESGTETDSEDDTNTESNKNNDKNNDKETDKFKYALQYGVFSEKARAEELLNQLSKLNIKGEILTESNKYKVISDKSETKEKAVEKLKNIPTQDIESVFITTL